MQIAFWLLWVLGTVTVVFGWLLAQAPGKDHTFDLGIWLTATVLLGAASLLLARRKRAVADPWLLVFIGAELLFCGYGLLSLL